MPEADQSKPTVRARAQRLMAAFEAAGATAVDAPILLPADTLLDLYGEDIRARAYVTDDPARGEQMLRPDFTVPLVQAHLAGGGAPARYAYSGEVFRRQDDLSTRASEFIQTGFEIFGAADHARADAEVFTLFQRLLDGLPLTVRTGDIALVLGAVRGLDTSAPRRAALERHIWRPARFERLLARFAAPADLTPERAALLAAADPLAMAGEPQGKRSAAEIRARVDALREDAALPPIPADQVAALRALLSLSGPLSEMPAQLAPLTDALSGLAAPAEALSRRIEALTDQGADPANLPFAAGFGRATMEYYDGFTFAFALAERPELPPLATGGRYDTLTHRLGAQGTPGAVGGVIRPGLMQIAEAQS